MKEDAMEQRENSKKDFRGQRIYIGIDVHKQQWNVSIRNNHLHLKTFSMNPAPLELQKYLAKNYPQGDYQSVYEAGYCGFWIHEELERLGIKNKVVNPGDVPTRGKEKLTKSDTVDSRKLARELESEAMSGIYVPSKYHQELRSLCRLRYSLSRHQARLKNRIKGHLSFYGKEIPSRSELYHWSNRFIQYLKTVEFDFLMGKEYLSYCLEELEETRKRIAEITKKIRREIPKEIMELLVQSVPGVGTITAATLYSELIDMNRFKRIDELASYIGLIPSTYSSGQTERSYGITIRRNKYLRSMLIESAWIAVREDPALLLHFNELTKRMTKTRAIIPIAKQLLRRIRYVWLKREEYVYGITG